MPSTTLPVQAVTPGRRPVRLPAWVGNYNTTEAHTFIQETLRSICCFTLCDCFNLKESRSKAKPTVENPSPLTWARPMLEGSVPRQCPLSAPREIITDKPNPSGTHGMNDPHLQVSCQRFYCQEIRPSHNIRHL